jgi:hypothetical protein
MNYSIKIFYLILFFILFSCSKKEDLKTIITISAVGDIMAHDDLQEYALSEKDNYLSLFKTTKKVFLNDDLTFGNLETPINDNLPIMGYPCFNAKSMLLDSLKECGFDVLSLANNHMLDQGIHGLKNTINEVYKRGIIFAGSGLNRKKSKEPVIIYSKGIKIGYISITSVLNIAQDERTENYPHVNYLNFYNNDGLKDLSETMKILRNKTDILIVSYHAGEEYVHKPDKQLEKIFKIIADNGADVILGHHPHVLQPVELYTAKDNRSVLIAYSLGNFISSQARYNRLLNANDSSVYEDQFTRTSESIILQFDIVKMNNISCVINPRIYPLFNYTFIKKGNKRYYNGYKTMFIDDLLAMDLKNETLKFSNLPKIKKVVYYRLDKIRKLINLPEKPYFSE